MASASILQFSVTATSGARVVGSRKRPRPQLQSSITPCLSTPACFPTSGASLGSALATSSSSSPLLLSFPANSCGEDRGAGVFIFSRAALPARQPPRPSLRQSQRLPPRRHRTPRLAPTQPPGPPPSAAASASSFPLQHEDGAGPSSSSAAEGPSTIPPPGLVDHARALAFYLCTLLIAVPLFLLMLLLHPLVLLLDRVRRRAQHTVNDLWANITTSLFYRTEIVGKENLPAPDEAVVYVSNHQSQLDIYTLFQLHRPFKFISKTSNFLIPIIGWSMFLTGHVGLRREDKRSQMECLKQCLQLLQKGVPVLFFPEGTRSKDGRLGAFKKGAFSIAVKAGVPVIPITLLGTGLLMPNGKEGCLYSPLLLNRALGVPAVQVVVHPRIQGTDADSLCRQARDVIARTLLDYGQPVAPVPGVP